VAASELLEALGIAARGDRGHEPWVFYPQGGRWRWWSFRRGWTEVERWQAALERGDRPSIDEAPAPQSSPQALCCHLAAASAATVATGVFDVLLAPRPSAREIVVVTPPAAASPTEVDRLAVPWLHWCCANLAVLVLEPSREALVGSVLWCRPTVLLAGLRQELALAAAVRERSRGRARRASALLDRLRVLLVAAEDRDTAGEAPEPAAFWRSCGVERRLVGREETGPSACSPGSGR
jgi:hypothetical protein